MPETASLETHEALPPPAARRDVRVVTPEQLVELRREQQEIYQSLRSSGSGPSDAARQIGIPRSLADEWERQTSSASSAAPAPTKDEPAPAGPPATAQKPTPANQSPATKSGGRAADVGTAVSPAPVRTRARPRPAERAKVTQPDGDTGDLARQARECAQRVQRELTVLKRLVKQLEAATTAISGPAGRTGTPGRQAAASQQGERTNAPAPEGAKAARIPPRAPRSSLTRMLLARGRTRQHPAPPSRT